MASAGVFAFQMMRLTTWLIVPSSVSMGCGSRSLVTLIVQPGFCATDTDGVGVSGGVGNAICTSLTRAAGSSFGTRNEIFAVEPCSADGGSTVTCAAAGAASAHTTAPIMAAVTAMRLPMRSSSRGTEPVGLSDRHRFLDRDLVELVAQRADHDQPPARERDRELVRAR